MPPENINQEIKEEKKTNNQEMVDNFEKKENKTDNWNQDKIKTALENKFWENEQAIQQLQTIFGKVKAYWEENISNFIIKNLPKRGINTLLENENSEKTIIEMIETYLRDNGIKINISTYTQLEQKDTQLNKTIEINSELTEILKQTKSNYDKLPPNLKPSQDQLNQQKKDLEQKGTLNKLREKWLSEDQINDYVTFNYTYTNHQEELKDTEFWKSYEKLQNTLFPRDRSINVFTWENAIAETNTLIESNENLNQYSQWIDTGNTTSTQEYQTRKENITKLEKPEEIDKEFNSKENQNLIEKYTKILPEKPEEDENKTKEQNEQQLLQRKKNTLLQINDLEQQTQTILQKRILWSAISGLAGYFDFSTAEKENIENDFIANNMTIDQNIFSLKGNINGKNINVNYNLQDGNLAMEDYLFQENDQKVIKIWEKKFQNLNILLPSLTTLKDDTQDFLKEDISGDNPNEYLKNLENGLHQKLTFNFKGNQEIIKVRLERATQKNLAVQETLKNFNKILTPEGKDLFTNKDFWEETTEKNLFKLMQTIDNSLENYSISDIEERRKNMNILTNFIETSLNDQTPDNKMKEVFKKNLSNQTEKNNYENQTSKTEYLYKVINSFCTTKNTKEIVNLENFKKLTDQLHTTTPDTNKLWEKTSKLFEPTEENPDLLLAKWPE